MVILDRIGKYFFDQNLIIFLEMAERHDAKAVLNIAKDLVHQIQTLMENK